MEFRHDHHDRNRNELKENAQCQPSPDAFKALRRKIQEKDLTVGVIGLGYVCLPFIVEKAKVGLRVLGLTKPGACKPALEQTKPHR